MIQKAVSFQYKFPLPVVDYLYSSILFNPEFSQDDVMHTAHWIRPRVSFFMSVTKSQHLKGPVRHFLNNNKNFSTHNYIYNVFNITQQ